MSLTMHQVAVPVLARMLGNLAAILAKARDYAAERDIDEGVLLEARLYPDMFPLVRQVQIAADVATRGADRLAGEAPNHIEDTETTFDELIGRLESSVSHLEALPPAAFDGAEVREVSLELRGNAIQFTGQEYLLNFVFPNVFFHVTTAYDILRHSGLEIGKRDFLGDILG